VGGPAHEIKAGIKTTGKGKERRFRGGVRLGRFGGGPTGKNLRKPAPFGAASLPRGGGTRSPGLVAARGLALKKAGGFCQKKGGPIHKYSKDQI